MKHLKKENIFKKFFLHIYKSYIPNGKDNLKQIILKLLFIICLVTLVVSSVYLANYFWEAEHQEAIVEASREIWHEPPATDTDKSESSPSVYDRKKVEPHKIDYMLKENSDFKGWITISGTKVDNPIYQTTDNEFYLSHNQLKQKSAYGALYFDCRNKITDTEKDQNLIVYGHEMKNGSMFGSLKKLKSLDFFKQHATLEFSTLYEKNIYRIYAVFILNATKADDDGYIYNIYRKNFKTEADFYYWTDEAFDRSVINTGVDVEFGDDILTLVTCSNDFPNARLIVMARKVRDDEPQTFNTDNCTVNSNPRYPKKWYEHREMEFPFEAPKN